MRLQKTIVQDGKQNKNQEAVTQYIYENAHPAIISAETYAQAQITRLERSKAMQQEPLMQMDW